MSNLIRTETTIPFNFKYLDIVLIDERFIACDQYVSLFSEQIYLKNFLIVLILKKYNIQITLSKVKRKILIQGSISMKHPIMLYFIVKYLSISISAKYVT